MSGTEYVKSRYSTGFFVSGHRPNIPQNASQHPGDTDTDFGLQIFRRLHMQPCGGSLATGTREKVANVFFLKFVPTG